MDLTNDGEVHKHAKKERGQYPAILTEQAWPIIKGFIICLKTPRNPEQAVSLHLARSGSQSQRAIWFILPAHGASHVIKVLKDCV